MVTQTTQKSWRMNIKMYARYTEHMFERIVNRISIFDIVIFGTSPEMKKKNQLFKIIELQKLHVKRK